MNFHPEAVGRAPGRVNLIGEHTDYNAGLCLPLALPQAASAALAPLPGGSLQVRSGAFPDPWAGSIEGLAPGAAPGWVGYVTGVLWALRQGGLDVPGLDIRVDSDVPIGAGLSSSAALECAVAVAVAGLLDLPLTERVRTRLAHACVRAETEYVGAPTGGMDQTVAMLATAGSALLIDFDDDTTSDVPLLLDKDGLTLVVTDTGVSHSHATGGYAERRDDCEAAASALGLDSLRQAAEADLDRLTDERLRRRARHVVTENARVTEAVDAIGRRDWPAAGRAARRVPPLAARRLRGVLPGAGPGRDDGPRGRRPGLAADRRRLRRLDRLAGPRGAGGRAHHSTRRRLRRRRAGSAHAPGGHGLRRGDGGCSAELSAGCMP